MSDTIRVLVRVRPFLDNDFDGTNEHEAYLQSQESAVATVSDTTMEVESMQSKSKFVCTFDHVFNTGSSQQDVYDIVRAGTSSVLDGFNSTIFAYGQTGSGKTFTMYGPPDGDGRRTGHMTTGLAGVIPRAVSDIFEMSEQQHVLQFSVYCSFVQVYNEQLFDMLRDVNMTTPLMIREDRENKEMYVQGLSEYSVRSVNDALQLLKIAEENRTVRETYINQFSSRSHSIFQMYVEQKQVAADGGEVYLRAKYNLVDLAGSEKWNLRQELSEDHVTEMTNINLSLHTLGRCISSLVDRSQGTAVHVPYRESKLTRLLQDSLGGNARTFLVATVSPDRANCEETISTLKFADNAKRVMVQAVINETRPVDHALVKSLQDEVQRLKQLVAQSGIDTSSLADMTSAEPLAVPASTSQIRSSAADDGELAGAREALQEERKRSQAYQQEISGLRRALHDQKEELEDAKSSAKSTKPEAGRSQAEAGGMSAAQVAQAGSVLQTIMAREVETWKQMDKMKRVLEKFFRFELEEEVLKGKLDKFFASLSKLQDQSLSTIDQVQTGQMTGAPLHPLLASRASITNSNETHSSSPSPAPAAAAPAQEKKQPLFKKSEKAKVSGAGAAAAMSAMEAFSAPGGTAPDDDDEPITLNIDTNVGGADTTPVLSVESSRSAGSSVGKPAAVNSRGGAAQPRQLNVPVSMQQQQADVPQVQEEPPSTSFLTSVDSGLPTIRSSLDAHSQSMQQQQQQQQHHMRASAEFGMKKPSPKHSQQQPQGTRGTQQAKQRRGSGGGGNILGLAPRGATGEQARVPAPPQQQAALARQQQVRQMNVPVSMQPLQAKQGTGGGPSNKGGMSRQSSQKSLGRDGSRVRLEAADIIDDNGTSEEEEEAMLRKELVRAQKKLKKQQQLQEWLREKENRAMAAQAQEEEAKKVQEQEEAVKEKKRKEYARKQKERLQGYKSKISQEAEKIQQLVDLGISPDSLF